MHEDSDVHRNPSGAVVTLLTRWKNEYLKTGRVEEYEEQEVGR